MPSLLMKQAVCMVQGIDVSNKELVRFVLVIVKEKPEIKTIAKWFKVNSKKIKK